MGCYFVMSMRFNKCTAYDFGLLPKDTDTAIDPDENSIWKKTSLYDFGWGKENGFYKFPLPGFDTLFELALYSNDEEDTYGAASVILDKYADELLCKCESFMNDSCKVKEFKRMAKVFKLNIPINRCSAGEKTFEQVQNDYTRWEKVSGMAEKIIQCE